MLKNEPRTKKRKNKNTHQFGPCSYLKLTMTRSSVLGSWIAWIETTHASFPSPSTHCLRTIADRIQVDNAPNLAVGI